jgi:hypothetical protein
MAKAPNEGKAFKKPQWTDDFGPKPIFGTGFQTGSDYGGPGLLQEAL